MKPVLYLGAPAWSEAGPGAYASIGSAQGMKTVARNVAKMKLKNFGGVMFWDVSTLVLPRCIYSWELGGVS